MSTKVHPNRPAAGARRPRRETAQSLKPALGYTSAPTNWGFDGPEVRLQRERIEHSCRLLGLELIDMVHDQVSDNGEADRRPGLGDLLRRIDSGEASCLVVSDLERLSSSVRELGEVLEIMQDEDRRLIALDVELDTDTPAGRLAVSLSPGVRQEPVRQEPVRQEPVHQEPVHQEPVHQEPQPAPSADMAEAPPPSVSAPPSAKTLRALGYACVPADQENGVAQALEAQADAIDGTCTRLGLSLVEIVRERAPKSGKALDRAGVSYLVERLAAGDASCLVVTGLDRLSHSVAELGRLVEWLEKSGVRLVAVDLGLDTANPGGQTAARALTSVAGWEQDRLSERTRKGLAAARNKRRERGDGSEPDWATIRRRIALMRADGMTLQAIADVLNKEGVPTVRGGATWRPSSVQTAAGYKRRRRPSGVADLPPPRSKQS